MVVVREFHNRGLPLCKQITKTNKLGVQTTTWSNVNNTERPYLSNHSTDHYQIFSSCYLCEMKARLTISAHLQIGNYSIHHTTNTGESREVKIKINLLDLPLYNYAGNIFCHEYIYFNIITHLYHYGSDKHKIRFC